MTRGTGSVWAMLVWKEWRQQWLVALLLACFSQGSYLVYCRTDRWQGDGTVLLVLVALAGFSLGTSAFTAESDDQTEGFVVRLPIPVWQQLAVKYLFAMVLALLCLVLPVWAVPPVGADWLASFAPLPQTPRNWALLALAVTSGSVALTGILARLGLGSMGTWLTAALLGSAVAAASLFATVLSDSALSPYHVLSGWGVIHLWLARVWFWRRPGRVCVWRAGLWIGLVLLVPVLPGISRIIWQRGTWGLDDYLPGDRDGRHYYMQASPSPDGRTLAIGAQAYGGNFPYAGTWLMDVGAGRVRRIGPWWRNCQFSLWEDPASWSPDSSQIRVLTAPIMERTEDSPDEWLAKVRERIYDVRGDRDRLVSRRSGFRCHWSNWLGDGTNTNWTPTAWEFVDPTTGEVQRCLHPAGGDPIGTRGRCAWLESAIVTAAIDREPDGKSWLRVWRSAPELPEAERRDLPADPAFVDNKLHPWVFSNDGQWLVLGPAHDGPQGVMGLVSLADGAGCLLRPPDGCGLGYPFFTADSRLLVVPSEKSLQVWNVTTKQWEAGIALPPFVPPPSLAPRRLRAAIAVSPTPPWRVAVGVESSSSVHLADLAQHTLTEALKTPLPEGRSRWNRRVSWLGNDRLLIEFQYPYSLWIVDADGTSRRQVLP